MRFKKWRRLDNFTLLMPLKQKSRIENAMFTNLKWVAKNTLDLLVKSQKLDKMHTRRMPIKESTSSHKQLRRFGNRCSFKVLTKHPNEIEALVEEISATGIRPKA